MYVRDGASPRVLRLVHAWLVVMILVGSPISAQGQASRGPGLLRAQNGMTPMEMAELEPFLDGVMASQMEIYSIPGATLAIVGNGEIHLAKGYGFADLDLKIPADATSALFRVGSVSKLLTATAVMQLVEQGRLDLDSDVNTYLDFTIPATFSEPITLGHLLTHTGGFEDVGEGLWVGAPESMIALNVYLQGHMPARVFAPGQVGAYSNYGMALAGYIVERVSNEPFASYVAQHIFTPLGMMQSTFSQPPPEQARTTLAQGYGFHEGGYVAGSFEYLLPYPAGAMSSTGEDMARFMLAHLDRGASAGVQILAPATRLQMQSRQYTPDPQLAGMAYGFMERRINGYRVLHHGGDTFLFHSGLWLLPEAGLGLFVSYNGEGGSEAREQLLQVFMDRYFPAPLLDVVMPRPDTAAYLRPFTGEYHLARANFREREAILRALARAQVRTTPEGLLLLTFNGRTDAFAEVAAGRFRHTLRDELLVLSQNSDGTTWLWLDGAAPYAFFRAPWYSTLTFAATFIGLTLLLLMVSALAWLVQAAGTWDQSIKRPTVVGMARLAACGMGIVLVAWLWSFQAMLTDTDPAFGVPRVYLGAADVPVAVSVLPWFIAGFGLALAGFSSLGLTTSWTWAKLHVSLLGLGAVGLIGLLWYWNFFGPML